MSLIEYQLTDLLLATTDKIIVLLESITPHENKALSLHKMSDNLYVSDDISHHLKAGYFIYLEVHQYHENDDWAARFTRGIKVGAADKIHEIFASAVAGVSLKHIKRPPAAIKIKPGCEYYQLLGDGPFWQQIIDSGKLGIIKGKEFSSVEMQLIAIEGNY
jgi:type VI secretion system protein ImpJ